jgi:phage baseplate assembly protein gpV
MEAPMFPHYFLGTVTDNADPDGLHRIRVTRSGEDGTVTDWIPVASSYTGEEAGLSLLPDVGDQILVVSLDQMNVKKTAIGGLWYNGAEPPETGENTDADLNQDGKNALGFFKSRAGHMFILDDTEGQEKIQIIASDNKSRLEFNLPEELVSLDTEHDLSLGAKKGLNIQAEEIEIQAEKQLALSGEEYQIAAKKALEIKADKDVSVEGTGLALN